MKKRKEKISNKNNKKKHKLNNSNNRIINIKRKIKKENKK